MHGTIEAQFQVERRPLAELGAIAEPWRKLAGRALEPNAFYEPAFALAAAPSLGRRVQVVMVWSRQTPARLVGLFPCVAERRYSIGPAVLCGWSHPYALLGTPLVDAERPEAIIAAWLDHVARDRALPGIVLLPHLAVEGAFAVALARVLAGRGAASADFDLHRRALLWPGDDRNGYMARSVGAKHRKEMARRGRRLAEVGAVSHEVITDEAAVLPALDSFFALEAAGWKGQAGTAASLDDELHRFFRHAIAGLAHEGKARVDLLTLDGKAIAATVALRSGDMMFGWKTAYDESHSKYSPGVQLMLGLTEAVVADTSVRAMDSCAAPNHPMIDHLWCDRRAIADRMFAVSAGRVTAFEMACKLETMRRAGIGYAKAVRARLKRALSRPLA
jgi:CelD/BcsL family acetyltransferase involved in cellulose biosynthesis